MTNAETCRKSDYCLSASASLADYLKRTFESDIPIDEKLRLAVKAMDATRAGFEMMAKEESASVDAFCRTAVVTLAKTMMPAPRLPGEADIELKVSVDPNPVADRVARNVKRGSKR